jgi:hypothetical protein
MSIAKRLVFADATTRRQGKKILEMFESWLPGPSDGGPRPEPEPAAKPKRARKPKAK